MKGYKELRRYLGKHLPASVKRAIFVILHPYRHISEYIMIKTQPRKHKRALLRVKEQSKTRRIKVAFFALHSAVWKYEGVYRLLEKDDRFDPIVVVCPVVNYGHKNMLVEMAKAYNYFLERKYNVVRAFNPDTEEYLDVKTQIAPDIIFYTNPYKGLIDDRYYITEFCDTLTCFVGYAYGQSTMFRSFYDTSVSTLSWRFFLETKYHSALLSKFSRAKGRNGLVTGYPGVDNILFGSRKPDGIWKIPDLKIKRIIWAPHHTIEENGILNYSTFLIYCDEMLRLAEKYRGLIQISLKPHPLLREKLYRHSAWGRTKTDDYFTRWKNGINTQLDTDDYVDLFNSSDAIIHDSGSFVVEYLHTGKPALYLMREGAENEFNEFGMQALNTHYKAFSVVDIEQFISEVVIEGMDTMLNQRQLFYTNLKVNIRETASFTIYDFLCKTIFQ